MFYFENWAQCREWLKGIVDIGLCTEEEITEFIAANKPKQYPCIAYFDVKEMLSNDDGIVYIYKDQIHEWSMLMDEPEGKKNECLYVSLDPKSR